LISRKWSPWSIFRHAFSKVPGSSEARCARRARGCPPRLRPRSWRRDQPVVVGEHLRRGDRGRLAEGDAPVRERKVERAGEGGLHVGDRQVVVLQHQSAGRVEGEVRAAAGVDAALVLLGEAGEQRLGLELVGRQLTLAGQPEDLGGRQWRIGLTQQLERDLGDGRVAALLPPLLLLVTAPALLAA
jgi:hypothetical protein